TRAVLSSWLAEDRDTAKTSLRTDVQGRWQLQNVPPGDDVDVLIALSHPDYIGDERFGQLQNEQHITVKALREQTAAIVMHRGAAITGTVTDPDGRPVKGAVVMWGNRYPHLLPGSQEVYTDENGVYRLLPLPEGPMPVIVAAQGWMPQYSKIDVATSLPPVNFNLKRGKKLRIRFVDHVGAPVSHVGLRISKWQGVELLYNDQYPDVLDTKIPRVSDENGIVEWDWAPDSPVDFEFYRRGFSEAKASITADDSEHVFTMQPLLKFAGTVADAGTGRLIEQFAAVPMIHFDEDFPSVGHAEAVQCSGGKFSIDFDRGDVEHSLQIEAPGYATVRTGVYKIGAKVPPLEIRMKPAPRFVGRAVDEAGQPVANARVYVGSYSEHLYL
ncbi:MAG: carboxypeptidase regulatory-like domain-containing protein, partial [Pirellulales bacterium]